MTREERDYAKSRIEYLLKICRFDDRDREALELAIKALEQEPCDDVVSREAAIKHLTKARMLGDSRPMTEIFAELPPVTQKSGVWIPVSERLPEDYKTVIASVDRGYVYPEARYSKEDGWEWAYEAGANYWPKIESDVIAWMPLPDPYEPQERSKNDK